MRVFCICRAILLFDRLKDYSSVLTDICKADARSGSFDIYVAKLSGGSWVELGGSAGDGGVSDTTTASHRPSLIIGNKSSVHVGPGVFVGKGKGVVPLDDPNAPNKTRCAILDGVSYCY